MVAVTTTTLILVALLDWFFTPSRVNSTLCTVLGGTIGAYVRARVSPTQETWSAKTLSDLLLGAVAPTVFLYPMPGALDTFPPAMWLFVSTWGGLSATWFPTVLQWLRRLGETPEIKNAAPPTQPAASHEEREEGKR